ncbi:MAG: hypothetical protein KDA71_14325 [Planctomycetales bacterium]|nr:hypothetical protein [Planctomycetales bacterium]
MTGLDPRRYGDACADLIETRPAMQLGPGRPNESARSKLDALDFAAIFGGITVRDRRMANCCLSGLWLLHDFLDTSHTISQSIETTSGSFWHGIMHRREPDYGNAKYWFRRVGKHPIFADLARAAEQEMAQAKPNTLAAAVVEAGDWDSFAFVDACQTASRGSAEQRELCERIAWAEWRLLFDYCYQQAIAS